MIEAILFTAALGALVGSFLNVVIHRVPRGESIVSPGSRCPACAVAIAPYDNVPVISWLVLRARCRRCAEPISARYPLVELLTALAFAAVAAVILASGRGAEALALELPFAALLIAVAMIDYDHRIVPNKILVVGLAWGLAGTALLLPGELGERLIAGGAAFAGMLLVVLAYPRGMGMGDVKLAGVMGLYLGVAVIPALFLAFLLGAAIGLATIARRGLGARKSALAFAPFLALGGFAGLIVGPELVALYSDAFL